LHLLARWIGFSEDDDKKQSPQAQIIRRRSRSDFCQPVETTRSTYASQRVRDNAFHLLRVWGAALGVPLAVGRVWVWEEAELPLPSLSL